MADNVPLEAARSVVNHELGETFATIQRERGVVPTSVRTFMQSLAAESMTMRRWEWEEVVGFDPLANRQALQEGARLSSQSAYEVLSNAPADAQGYVSNIGTLETIRGMWCGVYPFCRRSYPEEDVGRAW